MKIICRNCRKQLGPQDVSCPSCDTRSKDTEGLVMTSKGLAVPEPDPEPTVLVEFACLGCGRKFKTKRGRDIHQLRCPLTK